MIHNKRIHFKSIEDKLEHMEDLVDGFNQEIAALYLVGSAADGTVKPLSDLDFALLVSGCLPKPERSRLENVLYHRLVQYFGTEEIDLIDLNEAPLSIRYGILKRRRLLYSSNRVAVVDFEYSTILEYLDFKRVYDEMNAEFIKTVR